MVCQRPLSGLPVPVKRALRDQVLGIDRPSNGHSLPVQRATSAQSKSQSLGTQITSRRRLYYMATQPFIRPDTEIPTSPCNFKGIGRKKQSLAALLQQGILIIFLPYTEKLALKTHQLLEFIYHKTIRLHLDIQDVTVSLSIRY